MKKAALVDAVQSELCCGPGQARAVVAEFFALIAQGVADEGQVSLRGFGEFERRAQAPRPARDLRANKPVMLPARTAVRFRAAQKLREALGPDAPDDDAQASLF